MSNKTYPRMEFPFHELNRETIWKSIADQSGNPLKEQDLFWIRLTEFSNLDLDWYDLYSLKIVDLDFDEVFYGFQTESPAELLEEIMRILKEFGFNE